MEKEATGCEGGEEGAGHKMEESEGLPPETGSSAWKRRGQNRKESAVSCGPEFLMSEGTLVRFHHLVGVLLFSEMLQRVETPREKDGWILKQWLALILWGR